MADNVGGWNRDKKTKSSIFWDITAVLSVESHLTFRRNMLPQSSRSRKKRSKNLLGTCLYGGFLLGLFFDSEDGGDMFLRNVG
jgi:hypothetical protein